MSAGMAARSMTRVAAVLSLMLATMSPAAPSVAAAQASDARGELVAPPAPTAVWVAVETQCRSVALRASPTVAAGVIGRVADAGTTLWVDPSTVAGGSYQATCAGVAVAGNRWYRVREAGGVVFTRVFVAAKLVRRLS
jgi:hypothetical protein